jgi:hypothetical protein
MDDFSTQMTFEHLSSSVFQRQKMKNSSDYYYHDPTPPHGATPNYKYNHGSKNNNVSTQNTNQLTKSKRQMRHSVDNLLEIDTSYFNEHHQVEC